MNCHWCDTRLDESDLICRTCGRETVRREGEAAQRPPASRCYACDAPLEAGAEACASCGRPVAKAEPQPSVEQKPADVPDPNHPALANVTLDPEPGPPPMCPRHPAVPSKRACRRCGQFGCALCIPDLKGNYGLCVDCLDRADGAAARRRIVRITRRILAQSIVVCIAAANAWYFGLVQHRLLAKLPIPLWTTGVITAALCLAAIGCAVVFGRTNNVRWAWTGVTMQFFLFMSFLAYGVIGAAPAALLLALSRWTLEQHSEDHALLRVIERARSGKAEPTSLRWVASSDSKMNLP